MTDLVVRAAHASDAEGVLELARAEGLVLDLDGLPQLPQALLYVCEPGPAVLSVWIVQDELQIQDIAVALTLRRRGVGRALYEHAAREARKRGCTRATLEVRESNREALAFYARLGFALVGRRPRYYTDGEAALLLNHEFGEAE